MARGAPRVDFTARLERHLPALRARLGRHDTLAVAVEQSNASVDPQKVAGWLVRQMREWIPAPCWAVVAHDVTGKPTMLANEGLTATLESSLWTVAPWVLQSGEEYAVANLGQDSRATTGTSATVMAFPLLCRTQVAGALVGLDEAPSSSIPRLDADVASLLRTVLQPPAISLHNALALQQAEALSVTDDLTRLYNSRYLHLALRREVKRASRSGRPLSLLFLDLDHFKLVNDTHGHLAGSAALIEAAALVRDGARETDVAARFGGDEFLVILPDTPREGARAVAERLRDRFREYSFLAKDGLAIGMTASIGVATLPDVAASAEELIHAADTAMYRVKAAGKNGIHVMEEAI